MTFPTFSRARLGLLLGFVGVLIFGGTLPATRIAVSAIDPIALTSLRTAIEYWRGQPVAGVLLFTDGNATDIGADLPALDGAPPIYPVVLGSDSTIQDVSLNKVGVSQTACSGVIESRVAS